MSSQTNYKRYLEQVERYLASAGDTERTMDSLWQELKRKESKLDNDEQSELKKLSESRINLETKFKTASESLQTDALSGVVALPKKVRSTPANEPLDTLAKRLRALYMQLERLKKDYRTAVGEEENAAETERKRKSAEERRRAALEAERRRREEEANRVVEPAEPSKSGCMGVAAALLIGITGFSALLIGIVASFL